MSERRPRGRRGPDAEARFDEELRRTARSLVSGQLPGDVLDEQVSSSLGLGLGVEGSVAGRRPVPALAAFVGLAVVLVLSSAIAFGPRLPGGPGPSPTESPAPTIAAAFRTTAQIRADYLTLGYTCQAGQTIGPTSTGRDAIVRESAICLPRTDGEPYLAAVIVGESAAGQVVEVHAKADLVGADVAASRAALATLFAKAAAVVVLEGSGTPVGTWVELNLPALDANGSVSTTTGGVHLVMSRSATGSYTLRLTPAASSG